MWAAAPTFMDSSDKATAPPTASRLSFSRSLVLTVSKSTATCSLTSSDIASKTIL